MALHKGVDCASWRQVHWRDMSIMVCSPACKNGCFTWGAYKQGCFKSRVIMCLKGASTVGLMSQGSRMQKDEHVWEKPKVEYQGKSGPPVSFSNNLAISQPQFCHLWKKQWKLSTNSFLSASFINMHLFLFTGVSLTCCLKTK